MRGSYSGNTLAFQANAESSILLPRSKFCRDASANLSYKLPGASRLCLDIGSRLTTVFICLVNSVVEWRFYTA